MNSIEERIKYWCDILESKAKVQTYGGLDTNFHFSLGRSYFKIIMTCQDFRQNTAHAFVNRHNGDVYKPASWSAPYKDIRYNIWKQYDKLLNDCDWVGRYLYKR